MAERRSSRGLPIPSIGMMVVICAAVVAVWLIASNLGRRSFDPEASIVDNPVAGSYALEAYLRQEANPVPRLLVALDSSDPRERRLAARGLGRIGPSADQALGKLQAMLHDDDAQVRANAVAALVGVSPDEASAVAAIAPSLDDPDVGVRESVGKALCEIGASAVNPLLELLHIDRPETRLGTVRVFQYMRSHARPNTFPPDFDPDACIKPLVELFVSDQPAIRLEAVRLLRQRPYGTKYESMRADLAAVINDPVPEIRIEALATAIAWGVARPNEVREFVHDPARVDTGLSAIRGLGDDATQLLPDVLELLDDQTALEPPPESLSKNAHSTPRRLDAILDALQAMQSGARPATARLVEIAAARRDYACIRIAAALHEIGADDREVGRVLAPLLLDPDWQRGLSWSAGQSLARLCPEEARRQVAILAPKLGTNESNVDKTVLYALYALGPQAQEAVPAVVPLLHHRDPWVAEFAAHMLAESRTDSVDALENLTQALSNRSLPKNQRLACANALASCADALAATGAPAPSLIPALLKILDADLADAPLPSTPENFGRSLREAIITVLGRIGGEDKDLIPVLRGQLSSRSGAVRAAAADALGRVAGGSAEVFAELVRRLRDDDAGVRTMAALALGRMAPRFSLDAQTQAVAPLITALDDEYLDVRRAAVVALGQIGPAALAALPALSELLPASISKGVTFVTPDSLRQFIFMNIPVFPDGSDAQLIRTAIEQIEATPH